MKLFPSRDYFPPVQSCYYPPRRTAAKRLEAWLCRVLRVLGIEPHLSDHWFRQWLMGSLVPGRSFVQTASPSAWLPRLVLPVWLGLGAFALVGMGHAAATLAFLGMVSLHGASCANAWMRLLPSDTLGRRIVLSFGAWLTLIGLVYLPLRNGVLGWLAMPLQVQGHAVVIDRRAKLTEVRRGERIAWRIPAQDKDRVRIEEGFSVARVLGEPGDRVRITPTAVWVNDRPEPREPNMPERAELVLAEKEWFAWPALSININHLSPAQIGSVMLRLTMVDESRFVGRPFGQWFGRRQFVP